MTDPTIWQNYRPEILPESPFPFALFRSALSSQFVQRLSDWFIADAPWELHYGENFSHHRVEFGRARLPDWLRHKLDNDELYAIRQLLGNTFGVKPPAQMRVFANRIQAGEGIGLHTDLDSGVVACVTILNEATPPKGGHFVVAASDAVSDIVNVIPVTHNHAYAMRLTPHSYHAVTEVESGVRYSLCFLMHLA